jgi:hypothetical protein
MLPVEAARCCGHTSYFVKAGINLKKEFSF